MRAVWICPKLCGCEIEMDGEFVQADLSVEGGRTVSHRHAKPFTATNLVIVGVCAEHAPLKNTAVDSSKFLDTNEEGEIVQNRGYLRIDQQVIDSGIDATFPTEAETLYMNLYGYSAQVWKPSTCGCELRQWHHRDGSEDPKVHRHPKEKRCRHHKNDTDDAQAVRAENLLATEVLCEIIRTAPPEWVEDAKDEEGNVVGQRIKNSVRLSLKFDDQRKLMVILPNQPKAKTDKVLSDVEKKVGPGKIQVFGG